MLGSLGESLGNDLRVEGVGKDLGPILEWAIGSDAGGSSVVVALGDDLEGELGLGGVHGEDSEVVDDEQFGADVATQGAVEGAVDVRAMQFAEHALGGDDDDAPGGLARLVRDGAGEEGFAGARHADEERIDAGVEEREVVQGE